MVSTTTWGFMVVLSFAGGICFGMAFEAILNVRRRSVEEEEEYWRQHHADQVKSFDSFLIKTETTTGQAPDPDRPLGVVFGGSDLKSDMRVIVGGAPGRPPVKAKLVTVHTLDCRLGGPCHCFEEAPYFEAWAEEDDDLGSPAT